MDSDFAETKVNNTIAVIGRFEVLAKIGEGGMGKVYKVLNTKNQKICALKVIESYHNKEAFSRFVLEAQSLANLIHPNIVRFYEFTTLPGTKQYYLLMQYVEGKSLTDVIQNISITKGVRIFVDILHAMHYVHINGFVHRDLKPANILIDKDDKPYVMDFGIVKIPESESQITAKNAIMGTPAYMSPEQINGKEYIDCRTDIYSLGVILYEMLTKTLPFGDKFPIVMMNLAKRKKVSPQSINAKISDKLNQICQKALSFDINERYNSAKEFVDELEQCIRDGDITKKRDDRQKLSQNKSKTRSMPLVGGFVVILLLSLFFVFFRNNAASNTTTKEDRGSNITTKEDITQTEIVATNYANELEKISLDLQNLKKRVLEEVVITTKDKTDLQNVITSFVTKFTNAKLDTEKVKQEIAKYQNIEKYLDLYFDFENINDADISKLQNFLCSCEKDLIVSLVKQYLILKECLYKTTHINNIVIIANEKDLLPEYEKTFNQSLSDILWQMENKKFCPVKYITTSGWFVMQSYSFLGKNPHEIQAIWNNMLSSRYLEPDGNGIAKELVIIFLDYVYPSNIHEQLNKRRKEYLGKSRQNLGYFIRAFDFLRKSLDFIMTRENKNHLLLSFLSLFLKAKEIYLKQDFYDSNDKKREINISNIEDNDSENSLISAQGILEELEKKLLELIPQITMENHIVDVTLANNLLNYNEKYALKLCIEEETRILQNLEFWAHKKNNIVNVIKNLKKNKDIYNRIQYQIVYCKKYREEK